MTQMRPTVGMISRKSTSLT